MSRDRLTYVGARSIGEAPVILRAAAIAAAFRDATSVGVTSLPLSAERVPELLSQARGGAFAHGA